MGQWVKLRKPMRKYSATEQQMKIKIGGKMVQQVCKGMKGQEFTRCRSQVLRCAFKEEKCDEKLLAERQEAVETV